MVLYIGYLKWFCCVGGFLCSYTLAEISITPYAAAVLPAVNSSPFFKISTFNFSVVPSLFWIDVETLLPGLITVIIVEPVPFTDTGVPSNMFQTRPQPHNML